MTTSLSDHTALGFDPPGAVPPPPRRGRPGAGGVRPGDGPGRNDRRVYGTRAYLGRDLAGGLGIAFFIVGFGCFVGLSVASGPGREQLAVTLLFAFGLLLGLAVGPVINAYAQASPAAVWQAAGDTGAFVAALSAIGYATRRDLSSWARGLFWALLALIVFGIVTIFARRGRSGDLRRLYDR